MIKNGPIDAINDFTIHSLHHRIALLAFDHGKHVLSQKPLAVTMEGARQMCQAAEKKGTKKEYSNIEVLFYKEKALELLQHLL